MAYYDDQLKQLQAQIARSRQLNSIIQELRHQQDILTTQVHELEKIKLDEQADVDRLEGRSLAAFFYQVVGKLDEKLDQERKEAYAARVKLDATMGELVTVERDLYRCEAELAGLQGCERRYEVLLQEKAAAIRDAGGAAAEKMLQLEEQLVFLSGQQRELQEAISAGNAALRTAQQVLSSLSSAESWSTWDLFGGGMLTDLAKHSHLDSAQRDIEYLQSQLRYFKTELADVRIDVNLQIQVDGFLRFADYFFDNLFTDWAVMDKIHRSQNQVQQTTSQIEQVLSRLYTMRHNLEDQQEHIKEELDTLVRNAPL